MKYLHNNAKAFYLRGNRIGCLLIHGFTGSAAEMRLLGEHLNEQGYTVKGVLLKGHGTSVEDMEQTKWKDWLASAEQGLIELREKVDHIVVIGLSMGGLLALNLASKYDVSAVISLAAPIKITAKHAHFAPLMKYFKKYESKREKVLPDAIKDYSIGYDKTPIVSVAHLFKLIRRTKRRLKKIKCPALVIQSKNDRTVKHESAEFILKHLGSRFKKLVYLKESGHVITIDCEKEKAFKEIQGFLKQIGLS